MRKMWWKAGSLVAMTGLLATAGCGGGSSSTAGGGGGGGAGVTGLAVADKVSVVDAAQDSASGGKLFSKVLGLTVGGADSDYNKDRTFSYVHDRSTEAFAIVNEILCMIGQTKYADMVNQGVYKAQINTKVCSGNDSTENANASQQAGSSATGAPEYETWIVDSTRPDNNSPQTVKVWFHEKPQQHEPVGKFIKAKVVIDEAANATNPYGIFTMNFIAYAEGTTNVLFKGTLKSERDPVTGKVLLKFVDEDTDGRFREAVALEKNADGTGGGSAYQYENFGGEGGIQEGTINFAYNTSLFHRMEQGRPATEACLDRTDFETSAWRYGMYDATTGSRVNVSSGFPINTAADGKGANGWVGFWGLWLPQGVTINDGATVYKQTFGPNGGTSTPYTVQNVKGKLKRHSKFTTTLADIKNIPLEGYQEQVGDQMMSFRVIWNGSSLVKIARAPQSFNGPPAWEEIPHTSINTASLNWGELNFHSQALGGQARVKLSGCTFNPETNRTSCTPPNGETPVVYFKENIVYPGDADVPAALACYDNCPKAGADGINSSDMTYARSFDPMADSRHDYTFANMVLKDGANDAILESVPENQPWGFNSGALFAPTAENMAALACDWNPEQTCGWKAWSALDEFYTWETGPNNWNQLTVLKDANGVALTFEQPLRVEYTHVQTNVEKDDNKYNGVKFFLDYNGFGELHGIPGKCFDMNSGRTVPDCNGPGKRWVPEFTIPEGSSARYLKNSVTYNTVIKPLEVEQRMVKLEPAACSSLPLDSVYTLPSISAWVDPAIGDEPVVSAAPAVIGGVVQ